MSILELAIGGCRERGPIGDHRKDVKRDAFSDEVQALLEGCADVIAQHRGNADHLLSVLTALTTSWMAEITACGASSGIP